MARKRMISPEIWESQDFSQLSDVAKIVFISLFSHADDAGRGRADPTYIKSSTFPYDEGRRVADIKSALSEIARSMSVQFYSVNGIEFYFMTSWERWQKIDKPSKSKLPPPPSVGVGGDIPNCEKFDEDSTNIRGVLDEDSTPNTIQDNTIKDVVNNTTITPSCARTREEWEALLEKQCDLDSLSDLCVNIYGNDEVQRIVLGTLLDLVTKGENVSVGGKDYGYGSICASVELLDRRSFCEIEQAFYEADNVNRRWIRKRISNPTNYIVSILMSKEQT